jgi:hypothetical protein
VGSFAIGVKTTQAELNTLAALFVDELRCSRRGGVAPSHEWTTQRTDKGRRVDDRIGGNHQGAMLDPTSVLGRRTTR